MVAKDVYLPHTWRLGEWFHIVPVGDVHRGSPEHASKAYLTMLQWCTEKDNYYVIGLGEYDDWFSGSERRAFRVGEFHDGTVVAVEAAILQKTIEHAELYRGIAKAGRLLGLAYGHHSYTFQIDDRETNPQSVFGKTTTQVMCEALNVPYLGFSGLLNVCMKVSRPTGTYSEWRHFTIYYHHGHGAARTKGGSIAPVRRKIEGFQADIYLMRHDHSKWALPETRLRIHQPKRWAKGTQRAGGMVEAANRLTHSKVIFARTASFVKGYSEGTKASYQELAGYQPTEIGVVKVTVRWKFREEDKQQQSLAWAVLDGHASA